MKDDTQKLFLVTAKTGTGAARNYYVIATDPTTAGKKVQEFYEKMDYFSIKSLDFKSLAEADDYGEPSVLLP